MERESDKEKGAGTVNVFSSSKRGKKDKGEASSVLH